MDIHYERDADGAFVLVCDEERLGPFETIGIAYDVTEGLICLLKHGSFAAVKAWHEKAKLSYGRNGLSNIASDMHLVELRHVDVADLNHFISTSALPEKWIEKLQPIDVT